MVNNPKEPDWRTKIQGLMKDQDVNRHVKPADAQKIARYVIIGRDLYRRSFFIPLLKCVSPQETSYIMDELHNGICGFHTKRRTLKASTLQAGYYWPTMEEDAKAFVQKCEKCHVHANILHAPKRIAYSGFPLALCQVGDGYSRVVSSWPSLEKIYPGRN